MESDEESKILPASRIVEALDAAVRKTDRIAGAALVDSHGNTIFYRGSLSSLGICAPYVASMTDIAATLTAAGGLVDIVVETDCRTISITNVNRRYFAILEEVAEN